MYGSNGTYPHHEEYMKLWKNDIWGKNLLEADSHRSYRPLLAILFKFLVHGTGGLNPTNFRIVSVALHCVATVWVAQLGRHTFGSNTLGFSAAMLFASHPVHVEAVAAVVNLAEAASLIFYIVAYFVYKYATTNQRIHHSSSMVQYVFLFGGQLLQIALWLCLMTISVLFKETGITLCGVIVASSIIQLLSSVRTKCFLDIHRSSDNTTNSTWFARGISVIQSWTTRHVLWIMASFYAVLLYFVFRTALIAPEGSFLSNMSVLVSIDPQRWQQFHSNVGKAYLGESQLIRKAENPFSLLQGEERLFSMMVSFSFHLTHSTQQSSLHTKHSLICFLNQLCFLLHTRYDSIYIFGIFINFCGRLNYVQNMPLIVFPKYPHLQVRKTNSPVTQYMIYSSSNSSTNTNNEMFQILVHIMRYSFMLCC